MVLVKFLEPKDNPFNSDNARNNLKNRIKKLYKSSQNEAEFRQKFIQLKQELIDMYFIKNKMITTTLFLLIDKHTKMDETDDGVTIKIEIEQNENRRELIKEQIKYKKMMQEKQMKAYEKLQDLSYEKDNRVTELMALLYKKVIVKAPLTDVMNPKEILDNLTEAKKKYYKYLLTIINNDQMNPYEKDMLLNNVYTEYMSLMTGIPVKIPKQVTEYLSTPNVEVEDVDQYRELIKGE